jgi:hypothetical protein
MMNGSLISLNEIAEGINYQELFGEAKGFTTNLFVILVSMMVIKSID